MTPAVVLLDTSVLVELLNVPNMNRRHAEVKQQLRERHARGETLLLPLVAILETGNHIAQNGTGDQRRAAAGRFMKLVQQTLDGEQPFAPTRPIDTDDIAKTLLGFDQHATVGVGFGDRSILVEADEQRALHRGRAVEIWSFDAHLTAYNRS